MKARNIRYLEHGGAELVEYDVADPGIGEVQVRGAACGICAWDLHTFRHGSLGPSPAPAGHEGIGYVTKVGPGVTNLREGDRVAGGGFATVANLKAAGLCTIPNTAIPDALWVVEPTSCVVTGVDHCALRIGDRVALVGCGFMGMIMMQCLAHSFAELLLAFDVSAARLQMAQDFGAHRVYNPAAPDFEAQMAELKALEIDTVVDASGAQAGLDLATRLVRRGGRINLFGWNHGPTTFSGDAWHGMGLTVVNSSPSAKVREPFPVAIRLIAQGIVNTKPLVTHVVPLEELPALLGQVTRGEIRGYIKGVATLS